MIIDIPYLGGIDITILLTILIAYALGVTGTILMARIKMSESLEAAIRKIVQEELGKLSLEKKKTPTVDNPQVTRVVEMPQVKEVSPILETDTVENLNIKSALKHLNQALKISSSVDTDADSRPDIFNKLETLEKELRAGITLLGGETENE